MEKKKEFLEEFYQLLDKYNVEINMGLDGDTHGVNSWLCIDHAPDTAMRWKTEEIVNTLGSIDKWLIKEELDRLDRLNK
jgi:hypothetical protein